jgi:hypothetical protein
MKQIYVRNDSSIDPCRKVKNDNYQRPVSQRNNIMVGFVVKGHIYECCKIRGAQSIMLLWL